MYSKKKYAELDVKPINRCEKCDCEILDGDYLCVDCYKKKVITITLIFLSIWLGVGIITSIVLGSFSTFAVWWFWFGLYPFFIKKEKFITKRKMYYDVPVTLAELAPKLCKDERVVAQYRKKDGKDDGEKINAKYFAMYVDRTIYKDLPRATSNILDDFPEYLSFVRKKF